MRGFGNSVAHRARSIVILLHAPLPGAGRMQKLLLGYFCDFNCTNSAAAATAQTRVWENAHDVLVAPEVRLSSCIS